MSVRSEHDLDIPPHVISLDDATGKEVDFPSIRISSLPSHVKNLAKKLDKDQDGELGIIEVATALNDLHKKQTENTSLLRVVRFFVVMSVLMIVSVFCASIAAAGYSRQQNGLSAYLRGVTNVGAAEAIVFNQTSTSVGEMTNEELGALKEVNFQDGEIQFYKKGYARDTEHNLVLLLVEGGTITFDERGIVDATGDAKVLLETVFGPFPADGISIGDGSISDAQHDHHGDEGDKADEVPEFVIDPHKSVTRNADKSHDESNDENGEVGIR